MPKLTCIMFVVLVVVSVMEAEDRTVQGKLDVKPPVDRIEVFLEFRLGDDHIKSVKVQPTRPYRFKGEVPILGDSDKITVHVVVTEPDGYVVWQDSFQKNTCCMLDFEPRIRRQQDLYDTMKKYGELYRESDRPRSRKYFERAADLAESIGQVLVTQRQLAEMDFEDSGCQSFNTSGCNQDLAMKSLERLARLFAKPKFLTISEQQLHKYWQERLDYVLWLADFYSQTDPEEAFCKLVAQKPFFRRVWSTIVKDFSKSYPNTKLRIGNDLDAIRAQARVIIGFLN